MNDNTPLLTDEAGKVQQTSKLRGLYRNLDESFYRSHPYANKHTIDILELGTPQHVLTSMGNPKKPTHAMEFGTILHSVLLMPDSIKDAYHMLPDDYDGRKTYWKDWKEALKKEKDVPFLTKEEHMSILGIMNSVYANKDAANLIDKTEHEVAWFAPLCGVDCKGRVDCINKDIGILADIKTTGLYGCNPSVVQRSVLKYRYDVQAAFYIDGVTNAAGITGWKFYFIFLEKVPPYSCIVNDLDDAWLEEGRRAYTEWLDTYRKCSETGTWPGYPSGTHTVLMPTWARQKLALKEPIDYTFD